MATPASFKPTEDLHPIRCIYCYKQQNVAKKAMSVTCKFCHKPLKLENVAVTHYESKRQIATCGTVTVEKNGTAIADIIKCTAMVIRGKVKGPIECHGSVHIGPKAEVKGDINAPTLQVDAGAVLDGQYEIGPKALSHITSTV
jgi:hypothetical protein